VLPYTPGYLHRNIDKDYKFTGKFSQEFMTVILIPLFQVITGLHHRLGCKKISGIFSVVAMHISFPPK
jgi:hypothetical protein